MPTFTTAKKKSLTIKQYEKLASAAQIEADEVAHKYLHLRKLVSYGVLFDFNPTMIDMFVPLFISWDAIDFLVKNHTQIKQKFTIINLVDFGKMYRLIVETFKFDPKDLKELRKLYLNVKPA
jgi:hypothetical protein